MRFSSGLPLVPDAAQSGIAAIAAGYSHALALKRDGTILTWGSVVSGYGGHSPGAVQTCYSRTQAPVGLTVNEENRAQLMVATTGSHLSFQWRKDGNTIGGATNDTYTLYPAQLIGIWFWTLCGKCGHQPADTTHEEQ